MMNPNSRQHKKAEKRAVALAAMAELETEDIVRLSVDMPRSMHLKYKALCAANGPTMRETTLSMIREWLIKEEDKIK